MKRIRGLSKMEVRENIWGYLFILPWLLGFLWLFVGPFISSLYLSLTRYDIINPPKWVALDNYRTLFTNDPLFFKALKVTFTYALYSVPTGLVTSLLLALLLNQKIKAMALYRTIYYLPSILPGMSVWLLWVWLFDPTFGLFNNILASVGIKGPHWLGSTTWVMPSIILMGLWGIGSGTIIFLAALQGVPQELYDASEVDGAGVFRRFRFVTLPMISPSLFFNLIMSVIGTFQVFGAAYTMTNGGPNNATLFYQLYLYRKAFDQFRMGYAAALAWILFFIIIVLTLLIMKSSPMWVYYEGLVTRKRKG